MKTNPSSGLISRRGIYTSSAFRKRCSAGSTFWTIDSWSGLGPRRVTGPCTIIAFLGQGDQLKVRYRLPEGQERLTNRTTLLDAAHGIFLTAEDAEEHFRAWAAKCQDNPAYRQAVRDQYDFVRT